MVSIFGGRELWRQALLWLAVCVLAVGAGAVHQWQTGRVGVLGDYAYIVDTAWRIAQGEVMYRDFGLPHSPLTFHVQATLIRLFGFSYGLTAWYCTVVNVVYVVLTYGLVRVLVPGWSGVALCVPLVWLAPHCIYPHPFYDPDTSLLVLLNLNLLHWVATRRVRAVVAFLGGVTTVLPALGKQNVGYPYVLLVAGGVVWWGWLRERWVGAGAGRQGESKEQSKGEGTGELNVAGLRWFGAGVAAGVVGAVVWLGLTCGLGNYWQWGFASASRRVPDWIVKSAYKSYLMWFVWFCLSALALGWWLQQRERPAIKPFLIISAALAFWFIALIVATQRDYLLWSWSAVLVLGWLGWQQRHSMNTSSRLSITSMAFLLGPFIAISLMAGFLGHFFINAYHPVVFLWIPIMILTMVVGLWHLPSALFSPRLMRVLLPWLTVILAFLSFLSQGYINSSYGIWAFFVLMVAYVVSPFVGDPRQPLVCWGVAITLTLAAIPYVQRNNRLCYVDQQGEMHTIASGPLRGFTAYGPYLNNFTELLGFVADHIPEAEPVVCIPHEDPFYAVMGRRSPLPMFIFDRTANPFPPEKVLEEAERHQVKWVIVKRVLQFGPLAGETKGIPEVFSEKYSRVARLKGYDILYRSPSAQADSP
ncbi:hypothetical protein [Chloracidobacterium thermophilum]|uniref:hypothetical protein n=1 Tax=Chloracidobacterium thermophilum TaxID=458033 RepID=UPI0007387B25|nr:hypothetical protein [Chloracidobacterium thermophilum]